jgi:hypothetical protein
MKVLNNLLQKRDAIGLWDLEFFDLVSLSDDSEILVMDIPMKNSI